MSPGEEIDRLANENRMLRDENRMLRSMKGTDAGLQGEAQMPQPMMAAEMPVAEKLRALRKETEATAADVTALADLYESLEPGRRQKALRRLILDAFFPRDRR